MATTLLQLRMQALAQHVMEAQAPNSRLGTLQLSRKPDKNLWLKAAEAIEREAENLLTDLQKAMDSSTDEGPPLRSCGALTSISTSAVTRYSANAWNSSAGSPCGTGSMRTLCLRRCDESRGSASRTGTCGRCISWLTNMAR